MTVYLNMKTQQGVETIDQFTKEETQTPRQFREYVRKMIKEYIIAGMGVYESRKCTKEWANK